MGRSVRGFVATEGRVDLIAPERDAYRAGASEALRLTGHDDPELEALVQRVLA